MDKQLYMAIEALVKHEATNAMQVFPKFNSEHEGFAVLKEEVDELWEAIRLKQSNPKRGKQMKKEAIQVAAMAMRFLHDRINSFE